MIVDASNGLRGSAARHNVRGQREGKGGQNPPVRTLYMVSETPATGAADLIASRIPPGHINWLLDC